MNILVTGGAGFIGTNLVARLLATGHRVTLYDNLSRRGVRRNVEWIERQPRAAEALKIMVGDVRNRSLLADAARGIDVIFHLAAQVAVTTSVASPHEDFETNALGTLNVLEAARATGGLPHVIFTSTNKVYGGMDNIPIVENGGRYEYGEERYRKGVDESQPLDFHSPYGCSKGAADQYVHDYHRIYGMPTTVFRMSCIYGPHQFGNEDQGWVAHFIIGALLGMPLTIYGDGKQVRDILFVDDLVRAFEMVMANPTRAAGRVYNVGGGAENTVAIWTEFGASLRQLTGVDVQPAFGDWRPGDQLVYVSDITRIGRELGWFPEVSAPTGIARLVAWVQAQQAHIGDAMGIAPSTTVIG